METDLKYHNKFIKPFATIDIPHKCGLYRNQRFVRFVFSGFVCARVITWPSSLRTAAITMNPNCAGPIFERPAFEMALTFQKTVLRRQSFL